MYKITIACHNGSLETYKTLHVETILTENITNSKYNEKYEAD